MDISMGSKIVKGYKNLLEEANALIKTISIEQAISSYNNDEYEFIDLRDFREIQRSGKIPGAFSCPRGMLEFWIDPESPYHKEIFSSDKNFVFYCASAWRSALATKAAKEIGLSNVCHIDGGFANWEKSGGKIEKLESL
jgi:rhodanese-related sulfurtransferase